MLKMWKYLHSVKENLKGGYTIDRQPGSGTPRSVCVNKKLRMSKTLCSVRKTHRLNREISCETAIHWLTVHKIIYRGLPAQLYQMTSRTAVVWSQSSLSILSPFPSPSSPVPFGFFCDFIYLIWIWPAGYEMKNWGRAKADSRLMNINSRSLQFLIPDTLSVDIRHAPSYGMRVSTSWPMYRASAVLAVGKPNRIFVCPMQYIAWDRI